MGITTGKKIGNAVKRNRARRIIREAVRALLPEMRSGFDIILVARGKTPYLKKVMGMTAEDILAKAKTLLGK